MPSRRRFLCWSGASGLVSALPGCGWWADQPIAVAAHVWVGYEPMFLARDKGWLDPKQVQLFETGSASESIKALQAGKVQAAALTLDEVLSARAAGLPLSLVLIFNISVGADMLVARSGIKTLADLKGRRMGYEPSSVGELMLSEVLKAAGLTRDHIQLVPASISQQYDAWERHEVDALVTYEPLASQLLAMGDTVKLFDSRQIPNTIIDVLAVRRDLLDSRHSNALRHLIQGHFQALDLLRRNPQDAAYRMTEHLKVPVTEVLMAYKGLVLPDAANNQRLLSGSPPELLAAAYNLVRIMRSSQLLKQDDLLNDLIRSEFLPLTSLNQ